MIECASSSIEVREGRSEEVTLLAKKQKEIESRAIKRLKFFMLLFPSLDFAFDNGPQQSTF